MQRSGDISITYVNGTWIAYPPRISAGKVGKTMMRTNSIGVMDRDGDQDLFETVTEEEIIYLWRSIKGRGLSEDEAWQAVVTGIALDMAFAKSRSCNRIEH